MPESEGIDKNTKENLSRYSDADTKSIKDLYQDLNVEIERGAVLPDNIDVESLINDINIPGSRNVSDVNSTISQREVVTGHLLDEKGNHKLDDHGNIQEGSVSIISEPDNARVRYKKKKDGIEVERIFPFDADDPASRESVTNTALSERGADPTEKISGPHGTKKRFKKIFELDGIYYELAGDILTVDENQKNPEHNKFSGQRFKTIELEVVNPNGSEPDRKNFTISSLNHTFDLLLGDLKSKNVNVNTKMSSSKNKFLKDLPRNK